MAPAVRRKARVGASVSRLAVRPPLRRHLRQPAGSRDADPAGTAAPAPSTATVAAF